MTAVAPGRRAGLLPWQALWRQSRRDAAALAVGMVVVAAAAFLSSAVPQGMQAVATAAVRASVAEPTRPVDVVIGVPLAPGSPPDPGAAAAADTVGVLVEAGFPAELRRVLADPVTALVGPELKAGVIGGRSGRFRFSYLAGPGGPAVTWLQGRAPAATGEPTDLAAGNPLPVEVALSEAGADLLGVTAGARLAAETPDGGGVDLLVSGVYRADDPGAGAWAVAPTLLQPQLVDGAAAFASVGLLLSADSLPFAQAAVFPSQLTRTFTYRVVASRLDAGSAALIATQARALASGREVFTISGANPVVNTGLDRVIDEALARVSAASAQASVLLLGVLAVALLVEFLAAGLVIERRAAVLAQWRSRGATLPAIALAQSAETLLLTAAAGAVGVSAATAVTGGVPPVGWALPPLLAALLPGPLLAVRAAARTNRISAATGRRVPLTTAQLRRLAAEGTLVLLAAAALATLVLRGATASAASVWTDAVVLAAPVLVALAVGLGLVRVQPQLSALARRVAAGRPGAVPLVAAARVHGSGPALASLVVAAAVVAIAGTAAATVTSGRIDAAWDVVGADAVVTTDASDGLPAELAALDGSDGLTVATAHVIPGAQLIGSGIDRSVTVLAVDADALGRLLAATPAPDAPALAGLVGGSGLAALSATLPEWNAATLRWGEDTVTVRAVGDAPALPQQIAPGRQQAVVVDRAALAAALDRELPARLAWVLGPDAGARVRGALGASDAAVLTRDGWLAGQESSPLPRALAWLFAGASAVAALLAGLAVLLMAASGTAERTLAAARVRVVGTPRAAAARVAWLESAVPAVLASAVGLAVGAGLAALLVGALDLRSVTGGLRPPPAAFGWWTIVLPPALGLVAWAAASVATARSQRRPLGPLLRAG